MTWTILPAGTAARQACFCEALRSLVIASSRPRTDRVIVMEIPVRMRQTRTATETEESQSGLFCQANTTSSCATGVPASEHKHPRLTTVFGISLLHGHMRRARRNGTAGLDHGLPASAAPAMVPAGDTAQSRALSDVQHELVKRYDRQHHQPKNVTRNIGIKRLDESLLSPASSAAMPVPLGFG